MRLAEVLRQNEENLVSQPKLVHPTLLICIFQVEVSDCKFSHLIWHFVTEIESLYPENLAFSY